MSPGAGWLQRHQRPLFLVASGLSTSGSFAGLTAKGWILMAGTGNPLLLALHFAALALPSLLVSGRAGVLMDRLGWSRRRTTWLCVLAITLLGLPAALDVGVLERMDALFGGVLLIAAGLAMAVLLGWVAPQRLQADLAGCGSSPRLQRLLLLALRWISPLAIAVGLAVSVTDLVRTWAG